MYKMVVCPCYSKVDEVFSSIKAVRGGGDTFL